ncbi:PTS sugar transporter subunit IIA [Xylocopilactobacillus apis]|uniref:PTS EIIA type-1 domain-containing protein n=1 Tax=Xylocopilactobacillus apis TaxID=2932183 RepID=A0AAU9CU89_9LACO|nr:PTS glucose transporter subunit IIA [Xylocopilactobacillus apis]BDR55926.1 hypothetical protein KIMC2_04880 [Xylocopilactobacillus apis]
MFKFLHKNKSESLQIPIEGEVIELSKVSDPVFSEKMMGDGFGVIPSSKTIYAPISGKITFVADTKHGIGITSDDGIELLLHLGIDTVELNGNPFKIDVTVGDQVEAGQKLGEMDVEEVKKSAKDPTVMVVVTNTNDVISELVVQPGSKKAGEIAAQVTKK